MKARPAVLKTAVTRARPRIVTSMKIRTKPTKRIPAPTQRALALLDFSSDTDVLGSYTGKPNSGDNRPVQDADDL